MGDANKDSSYLAAVGEFDARVVTATQVSRGAAGKSVDDRRWWAALLFTRLCTTSVTLASLAPGSRFASNPMRHYDSSSIASITRNLLECYLAFYYLCVDRVLDDEWLSRLNVMQLHDCESRLRMFREFDPHDPQLPDFEAQAAELRERIVGRAHFAALPPKQQKRFLTGDTAWLLSRNELLERVGANVSAFRGFCRFLSAHAHSLPLAFYRMAERNQGRGVESDWEKRYTNLLLEFATDVVTRASNEMLELFPDAAPST